MGRIAPLGRILIGVLALCTLAAAPCSPNPHLQLGPLLYSDDFQHGLGEWIIEAEQPADSAAEHGVLDIEAPAGLTLWFRAQLQGPVLIEYDAQAVAAGGPDDRVSDLNCFWMATEAADGPDLPTPGRRGGAFAEYDTLRTYYVGLGGNSNTTTRFRRYVGHAGERPLLKENDRSAPEDLLQPNHTQHIRLVAAGHLIEYYRDGQRLFAYSDPQPYTHGWFGIRTTRNHLRISHFRVHRLISVTRTSRE